MYLDCDTTPALTSKTMRTTQNLAIGHAIARLNLSGAVGQIGVYTDYIHGDFLGYAIRYEGERAYFEPAVGE